MQSADFTVTKIAETEGGRFLVRGLGAMRSRAVT